MPAVKSLRLRGNRSACNCKLAVLTIQIPSVHVVVYWIDDARIDAREQHGFIGRLLRPCADRCEAYTQPHPGQETKEAASGGDVGDGISARPPHAVARHCSI